MSIVIPGQRPPAEVSFDASRVEELAVAAAVKRILEFPTGKIRPSIDWAMDLLAVNANGTPLDFEKLLGFSDGDFTHDMFGIYNHLNRETGQLKDLFSPRSAR